jgi:hypothetical protein
VNARNLEKDSFWVNVREDRFEDKEIFAEMQEKFASAPISKYLHLIAAKIS